MIVGAKAEFITETSELSNRGRTTGRLSVDIAVDTPVDQPSIQKRNRRNLTYDQMCIRDSVAWIASPKKTAIALEWHTTVAAARGNATFSPARARGGASHWLGRWTFRCPAI